MRLSCKGGIQNGANLTEANLSRAYLVRGNLSGADLSGASLGLADLDASLKRAVVSRDVDRSNAVMEDYARAEAHSVVRYPRTWRAGC